MCAPEHWSSCWSCAVAETPEVIRERAGRGIRENVTVNGHAPLVGVAVKPAIGTMAAEPVTALVEAPPLLANSTDLVTLNRLPDLKATVTRSVCPPFTVNGLPLVTANGLPATLICAEPDRPSPVLITRNCWVVDWPVASRPKSILDGWTDNWGGLRTTIRLGCASVLLPTGPLTVRVTV